MQELSLPVVAVAVAKIVKLVDTVAELRVVVQDQVQLEALLLHQDILELEAIPHAMEVEAEEVGMVHALQVEAQLLLPLLLDLTHLVLQVDLVMYIRHLLHHNIHQDVF